MHRTPFAGLTAPDPDDAALQVDGGSFATRNPDIIDYFLSIGAVTHRHDAHDPLVAPQHAPSAVVIPSGGSIESGTDLYFGWTASDSYGGETVVSPITLVSTSEPAPDPDTLLDVTFVSSAGVMPTGTFAYAITVMDAGGGEGTLGPATTVQREAGFASGQMLITGLTGDLLNDGDRWRLWRSDNGAPFSLIAVGTEDTFLDYGIDPVDHAATPPLDNTRTRATSSVQVTLPELVGASANAVLQDPHATAINLYLSLDGSFVSPALVQVYPIASAGVTVTLTDTFTEAGSPPEIATSIRGANKIDPDTELIDWHWKRPVAASAALPLGSATASGDVRVALDSGLPYVFTASGWQAWQLGGGGLSNVLFEDEAGEHQVLASAVEFVAGSALVVTQAPDGHAVVHIPGGGGSISGSGVVIDGDNGEIAATELHFGSFNNSSEVGTMPSASVDETGYGEINYGVYSRRGTVNWSSSAAMASGDVYTDTMPLGRAFLLIAGVGEAALRIRVYTDSTRRDADLSRPLGTPATGDHGCIFEYVTDPGETSWMIAPAVAGANYDLDELSQPSSDVAIAVTCIDSGSFVRSFVLDRLLLEYN